jgi:hypothetical protein
VEVVRRQLAEGDHFRREVEAYWEVCEELADAELGVGNEASSQEAEKGGFKRKSLPASSKKSRSS